MRGLIRAVGRTTIAMLVAGAAIMLSADTSYGRGGPGGGGRGGGGGGRGGGGARGGGGPRGGGPGGPGGKGKSKTAAGGMGGKKASDYVEQLQRESAEAGIPDFLFEARYGSLTRAGEDDRGAALDAEREKASTDRRDASESGAHPL